MEQRNSLLIDVHKKYIKSLDQVTPLSRSFFEIIFHQRKDTLEYWMTEHLRVSGVYWGLGAMDITNSLNEMEQEKVIEYIISCQQPNGIKCR